MDSKVANLLYRNPEYYEIMYPEPGEDTPRMCMRMFGKFLGRYPESILDIGCGTGRDLDVLSRKCGDCHGIDYLPEMVRYANDVRPHLAIRLGDMRKVRLDRTFGCIMCMGSAFMYALTGQDVQKTLATFRAHSHPGTLLILDLTNAAALLGGGSFRQRFEGRVNLPGLSVEYSAAMSFDFRRQLMIRRRTWHLDNGDAEDYCEYRLFFPEELRHLLEEYGFAVKGMYDNKELTDTDLSGSRLYVAAVYSG